MLAMTLPENGDVPCPAIVLVHGSGPNDMDEKIGNCYFFKDMAKEMARCGCATIRYNKRTKTYGKLLVKSPDFSSFTVWDETIEDALFAADLHTARSPVAVNLLYVLLPYGVEQYVVQWESVIPVSRTRS